MSNGSSDINRGTRNQLHSSDQRSLFDDLLSRIRRSFVNIYAEDTTIYGYSSKTIDAQRLSADLLSDLALTSQWGKTGGFYCMPHG